MNTYVIFDGNGVKVGHADDVRDRIRRLQTGNPNRLHLLASAPKNVESEMQKALKPYRMHKSGPGREWFDAYECSRLLSDLLLRHEFSFAEGWDLFRARVSHNRSERRAGITQPGWRDRAAGHGYERVAIRVFDNSRKREKGIERAWGAFFRLAHQFDADVVVPVLTCRWTRFAIKLRLFDTSAIGRWHFLWRNLLREMEAITAEAREESEKLERKINQREGREAA